MKNTAILILLAAMVSTPAQAVEPLDLYDDFNAKLIDPEKWEGRQSGFVLEATRKIKKKRLLLENRSYGNTDSDTGARRDIVSLNFADPDSVTAIKATVGVKKVTVTGCAIPGSSITQASARLAGEFFNTDSPVLGSAVNDVFATIEIRQRSDSTDPPGVFEVRGFATRCLNANCSSGDFIGSVDLGTVNKKKQVMLRIQHDPDNDQFIFQRDIEPEAFLPYTDSDAAPPGRVFKSLQLSHLVANCTAETRPVALMKASFNDVFVNESAVP